MLAVSYDVVTSGFRRPSSNSSISKLEAHGSWALTRLAGRTTNNIRSHQFILHSTLIDENICHRLYSSLQRVPIVTASVTKAKVISNGKFRPRVAPKPLNGFEWNSARIYVSANTWHVTCFGVFLVDFFRFSICLRSRCAIAHRPIFYRPMLCIRGISHGPLSVSVSVSVSLCLSQAGVLLKRQNVGSHKQHHTIPQGL